MAPDAPAAAWPTGPSCAGWSVIWCATSESPRSSTSARACPPRATCMRSPGRSTHPCGPSTSTTIRSSASTARPCWPTPAPLRSLPLTCAGRRDSGPSRRPALHRLAPPVGLLMLAILHHITDIENRPASWPSCATQCRRQLSGHFELPDARTGLAESPPRTIEMERLFNEQFGTGRWRSDRAILTWFGDSELIAPGLVPLWTGGRTTDASARRRDHQGFVGGIARKA